MGYAVDTYDFDDDKVIHLGIRALSVLTGMRGAEITPYSSGKGDGNGLKIGNITFLPSARNVKYVKIRIEASKSDKTSKGVDIYCGSTTHDAIDAVNFLLHYINWRITEHGAQARDYLFVDCKGEIIYRKELCKRVKSAVARLELQPANRLNGFHCMRIGCATELARKGASDSFIMSYARWKSSGGSSYYRYTRFTKDEWITAAKTIATAPTKLLNTVWDPQ